MRLDSFLASSLPSVSRNRLQKCIAEGLVDVNGAKAKARRQAVRSGDVVRWLAEPAREWLVRVEQPAVDNGHQLLVPPD